MTAGSTVRRRLQFSIRSLLIVTGLLALLLTPLAWMARRREQIIRAHEEAIRSLRLEHQYRAELRRRKSADIATKDRGEASPAPQRTTPAPSESADQIERLRRENAELRNTAEDLRREIRRLKAQAR
jgi:hypothetical protein